MQVNKFDVLLFDAPELRTKKRQKLVKMFGVRKRNPKVNSYRNTTSEWAMVVR